MATLLIWWGRLKAFFRIGNKAIAAVEEIHRKRREEKEPPEDGGKN